MGIHHNHHRHDSFKLEALGNQQSAPGEEIDCYLDHHFNLVKCKNKIFELIRSVSCAFKSDDRQVTVALQQPAFLLHAGRGGSVAQTAALLRLHERLCGSACVRFLLCLLARGVHGPFPLCGVEKQDEANQLTRKSKRSWSQLDQEVTNQPESTVILALGHTGPRP